MPRALILNRPVTPLLASARQTIGLSREKLGRQLRVSQRTVARWETGRSTPGVGETCMLARMVFPRDAALAEELAMAASESLESLGLVPPAAASPPAHLVIDAVVCVAADALGAAPGSVRGALHAAFRRARELGLSMDDVEKALAPTATKGSKPGGSSR